MDGITVPQRTTILVMLATMHSAQAAAGASGQVFFSRARQSGPATWHRAEAFAECLQQLRRAQYALGMHSVTV